MAEVPLPTPTQAPVPSTDIRNAVFAGAKLDEEVTGIGEFYTDRLGVKRLTNTGRTNQFNVSQNERSEIFNRQLAEQEGIFESSQTDKENRFQQFLLSSGYVFLGDYENGPYTIDAINQVIRYQGEFWLLNASTTPPYTTTGVNSTSWATDVTHLVSVGDATLRQDLSAPDGLKNIGSVASVAILRTIIGASGQKINLKEYAAGAGSSTGGQLTWINNSSYSDDGVVFFRVNSSGGWIRDWRNGINAEWAGPLVEVPDASDALNRISFALKTFNAEVKLPSGNIYIGDTWWLQTSQLKVTGNGSNTWLIGKPTNASGASINTPIVRVSNALWDSVTANGQYRLQDIDLRDFCISGKTYPLNSTTQTFAQSSRDALFLGGFGWDFQVQRVWFYNLGRRAVVAEDLWDGDFLGCKFHEICVDKTFSPSDAAPQTMVFKRKVDSCNAIRITNCHFEHCYRGAINIQDLCYSFFLLNNKFEAQNQNTDYPVEYPIYVGNNHRNFVWIGGFAVVSQQAKYIHYARIWGDYTSISDVKFIAPGNNDGAAILDLSYGNYGGGATVKISGDVRGDILNLSSAQVAPILSRLGKNDFSGTNLKAYNPGLVFHLASTANPDDVSKVRITGIGTNTGNPIIRQGNAIHYVNGLRYRGVAYTSLTDVTSKADIDEYALLYNLSTTVTFSMGTIVASASLAPTSADGTNTGSGGNVVGYWMCMGNCPPNKVSLFKRVS
ncbi:TPA: hypothetical protein RRT87_000450 [Klebsiella pneumoniae]|nr:hypothetical protein [Klebsiella pneumoniae]HDZ0791728.1 hypothetical protein [Klebsiella pneumoniae]